MASARTSDHHPRPMQATRRGLVRTTFPLRLAENAVCGLVSDQATRLLFPAHPDRLDSRLGDAQISLPVAAAHSDAADTLAVNQHRHTPLHGGPSLRSGGERKTDRMGYVEVLTGRSLRRGRAPI